MKSYGTEQVDKMVRIFHAWYLAWIVAIRKVLDATDYNEKLVVLTFCFSRRR